VDFTTITVEILKWLNHITGNYGLAIISLTLLLRFAMWPLGVSQQRSMRKMQELGPKMKQIQDKHKSDPQIMQKKMMEFYKEHKFNPFGGCLPMLLQMPIFILLYSALNSPLFILASGQSSFLFINKLYAPIRSHAGQIGDNKFAVEKGDTFSCYNKATVYTDKGIIKDVQINDSRNAVRNQYDIVDSKGLVKKPGKIIPGQPLDLKIKIDEINSDADLSKIQKAEILVINNSTKEVENLTFKKDGSDLTVSVPTVLGKDVIHYDVIALVILFGITMFFSQKLMTATNKNTPTDPAQQQMQEQMSKMMPFMITSTFIFFPIPAGVLLYMVVSNIFQVVQSLIINKQIDREDTARAANGKPSSGKAIEIKKEEVIIEQGNVSNSSSKNNK